MFYRRKLLLALLQKLGGEVSPLVVQNLLFLISRQNQVYEFIPYTKGCHSLTLESDLELYRQEPWDESFITEQDEKLIEKTLGNFKNEEELLKKGAEAEPYYTIKSDYFTNLNLSEAFYQERKRIIEEINESPVALYTIGYEGLSIEAFINLLIKHNVQRIIDVRGNPNSRKRDFAKKSFADYLNKAGIEYIGMSEIGIPNKVKREYLKVNRKKDLFEWYEKNVLRTNIDKVEVISSLAQEVNSALVCYEGNPNDCHRSYLAKACQKSTPSLKVFHLPLLE